MDRSEHHICVIAPCYNEGITIAIFLQKLEEVLRHLPYIFTVIIVDDCSADDTLTLLNAYTFSAENLTLYIVSLPENSGHQPAIYRGLSLAQKLDCSHAVVMDADGQDAPGVIPLLTKHLHADIVHVVRSGRSEPLLFRLGYRCYKYCFRVMTGHEMNFGNFCLISRRMVDHAVSTGFVHLAAFLCRQNFEKEFVHAERALRLGGKSKMGYLKLARHAMRSLVEYNNHPAPVLKQPMSR